MQCPKCHTTLVSNARFCPTCGTSLPATDASVPSLPPGSGPDVSISQTSTVALEQEQTPPLQVRGNRHIPDPTPPVAGTVPSAQFAPPQRQPMPWSAATQAAPPPQFAPQTFPPQQAAPFRPQQPFTSTGSPSPAPATRRIFSNKRVGCLLKIGIVLVVLLIVLTSVWNFALRPSLHKMAEDQMGQMLSASMEKINPLTAMLVPPFIPLPVGEDLIQQALVLPPPSWFSIQDLRLNIAPGGIRVTFQAHVAAFAFSCTIVSVPKVVNGQVTVDKLTVDGPITMVISEDDMKTVVNSYLNKLHDRMRRPITALTLADHYIWVTMGI